MTNPNNTVRVRARNGGRASVYEANGWAQAFLQGLLEGTGVIQNTVADMNVLVGGSATNPDVVLAENPSGYKIALDLVSQQAVAITAPASNNRISAIVAYTDDLSLATTQDTVTGSPATCGLIVVNGTTANNPVEPTDAQIRTAITADGATGSQAAYCVIATIKVASNTTVIDNALITNQIASLNINNIKNNSITSDKVDNSTFSRMTVNRTSGLNPAPLGTISLTNLVGKTGTGLSQSNGGIKIGAGISKIMVTASVFFNNSANSYGWVGLMKNDLEVLEFIGSTANNSFGTATLAPCILSVTEGEVYTLYNKESNSNIRAYSTYLTIEAIA